MILVLNIKHGDITYAVRNKTHKAGKSFTPKDPRVTSNMQADDTAQDTKIVSDSMDKAIGNVISMMSKRVSDVNNEENMTTIVLNMPSTWRKSNRDGMITDIYNYIVDFCVAEFFVSARDIDDARTYLSSAEASLQQIRKKMNDKKSPI